MVPGPVGKNRLRWWDGASWHHSTVEPPAQKSETHRKPWRRFTGPWVLVGMCTPIIILTLFLGFVTEPATLPLIFVPAGILGVALWWIDRFEPEPLDARLLALAWGATVAPLVGMIANGGTAAFLGEAAVLVISAPISEEIAKGAVILILFRRRLIDSPIDGVMYAIAVAAGFAIVEDALYFAQASQEGTEQLLFVFLGRGMLTPFAHPLFTIWMGVAAGWIATKRPDTTTSLLVGAGSLGVSISLHALWNGTLLASSQIPELLILVAAIFIVLFVAVTTIVIQLRRNQTKTFEQHIPEIAALSGLTPNETAVFANTRDYLKQRRTLNHKQRRLLGQLRWSLYAIGALRRTRPRNITQATQDEAELTHLHKQITALRQQLIKTSVR